VISFFKDFLKLAAIIIVWDGFFVLVSWLASC